MKGDYQVDITVIGAGAMGCLFGGKLSRLRGVNVLLIDRWEEHVRKINTDGLHIHSDQGVERMDVEAVLPSQILKPADVAIIFTKAQHTRAALEDAKRAFKKDTIAVTLQNGLGNAEKLAEHVAMEQVIVGTTTFPSDILEPGIIRSQGGGKTRVMSADGVRRTQTETVAGEFQRAGLNCAVSEDIFVSIWEKVAFNAALNSLCAVTRLPVGGIGATEEGRRLSKVIASEVIAVARRKGVVADQDRCHSMIEQAFASHKGHKPSMLQDILSKRTTEIDAINGAVVREARNLGLDVPATALLADLVKVIQKNF